MTTLINACMKGFNYISYTRFLIKNSLKKNFPEKLF